MKLQTPRLGTREFTQADAPFILELVNTPSWLEFIGDKNVHSIVDAEKYLENGPLRSYRENGFGLCIVELSDDEIPVGMCGLIRREGLAQPDIGFAFLPEYFGKGYGFEIASATLIYANSKLNFSLVDAITSPANAASISLLLKLGMELIEKVKLPGSNEELFLYRKKFG